MKKRIDVHHPILRGTIAYFLFVLKAYHPIPFRYILLADIGSETAWMYSMKKRKLCKLESGPLRYFKTFKSSVKGRTADTI